MAFSISNPSPFSCQSFAVPVRCQSLFTPL
ncbi:uncharacterized protein CCOS01_08468 [Colletotrichum costaricense]|uniref:Uncharacterized protein n=2 Tax=Colletotrichum acutatum species complex TaxID=2707335 RepID=A0AAI9YWI0_9PEZI|nr:uncharacterized protein CCOS01_08468 [Colletotrichum costaricense]XP_060373775.1 uncharacterized protein CTAM01_15642 [Colletotrichum tamarilloi]KAI3527311.1 hypothetical protein CSPX01_17078 [Colletotrichum filicis]KAK1475767.1 hypothetical protein CTAM01_15642 [Colletotrichum tamarilloi]KAK1526050.1 hypothetical protein CCOS01_08468 [Colletotrichum costaricense]